MPVLIPRLRYASEYTCKQITAIQQVLGSPSDDGLPSECITFTIAPVYMSSDSREKTCSCVLSEENGLRLRGGGWRGDALTDNSDAVDV